MNILYVLHSLEIGGAERITVETASAMKKRGHNVYVASPRGALLNILREQRITYYELRIVPRRKTPASFIINFIRLFMLVKKERIEVIHAVHRWANLICYFVCVCTGAKLVWTDHNILIGKKFLTLYKDNIISVSEASKKHLIQYFHIPEKYITVIHNRIRPPVVPDDREVASFVNSLAIPDNGKIMCIVANLTERKGHEYLLRAIPVVLSKVPDTFFVFAGEGGLKEYLINFAKKMGISGNVRFLGRRDDIPVVISAARAMILPSLYEGLPLSILEAFYLGRPVIATDVGGNREVIKDGETGIIVPSGDYYGLARAILQLLDDDTRCRDMGNRAREYITREFDFDEMISKIENVYKDALGENRWT